MHRLNYHHLLYFYTVAREGSVARASALLGLKQPTVSAQVHELEQKIGHQLFERNGRRLAITPAGRTVLRYAESIFALGGELLTTLDGQPAEAPKLNIGVNSSLPTSVRVPLVKSLLALDSGAALTIFEGTSASLSEQVSSQSLLFALDDVAPAAGNLHSRALLQSTLSIFAPASIASGLRKSFPARLASTPVLMSASPAIRAEAEHWLLSHKQSIRKLAEIPHPEQHAVAANAAIFAPTVLRESLKKSHSLLPVAELPGTHWRLFVISSSKSMRHPAIAAITAALKALS